MAHTDPLVAIPGGLVLAAGSLYAAARPAVVLELNDDRLSRWLSDHDAEFVLQIIALVTAGLTGWLVVHASRSLLGV